jgi:hypothetical protein
MTKTAQVAVVRATTRLTTPRKPKASAQRERRKRVRVREESSQYSRDPKRLCARAFDKGHQGRKRTHRQHEEDLDEGGTEGCAMRETPDQTRQNLERRTEGTRSGGARPCSKVGRGRRNLSRDRIDIGGVRNSPQTPFRRAGSREGAPTHA